MHRFWEPVIRPILEAVEPRAVVEIGAARGAHTRLLAEHARGHGWMLHVVDPAPRFEPSEVTGSDGTVVFHRERSLDALPSIGHVDVALIDGDHNWYTVINELRLLRDAARTAGNPTPVIVCHDVCWPYARRDLYYEPESVPPEERQPWKRAGIVRGRDELVPGGGLNAGACNAVHEGGPRNGVMTAIEDFAEEAGEDIEFTVLPVVWGLGILAPRDRLDAHPSLGPFIDRWATPRGWADLAALAEQDRERLERTAQTLLRRPAAKPEGGRERSAGPHAVGERPFATALGPGALARIQRGSLDTTWRGVPFLKSPFDIALYMELIGRLRPRTVIEVGTKEGGSALWFADALEAHGIEPRVVSIDVDNPPALDDDRIEFLRGDGARLKDVLPPERLAKLPHPFLVIEDSAHLFEVSLAVLDFFDPHLAPGDYIVVEDGIVSQLPGEAYERYDDGPNRAVRRFLEQRGDAYEIDTSLCDRYGRNVTWSPNGWLRRVGT